MCLSSNTVEIRRIAAGDTTALRDAILRAGLPPGGSVYPGDDAADTLHLGAFLDDMLVGVATLCRQAIPGMESTTTWRLRGMATLASHRGRGFSVQLAERCICYAAEHGATLVWCTSRLATVPFYRALGFQEFGEPFPPPQYSDLLYVNMSRRL